MGREDREEVGTRARRPPRGWSESPILPFWRCLVALFLPEETGADDPGRSRLCGPCNPLAQGNRERLGYREGAWWDEKRSFPSQRGDGFHPFGGCHCAAWHGR